MKILREEESLCVFVANLPASLSNPELAERVKVALSPYGNILGVKTFRDHKNRPFSFVQFEGPVIDFMLTEMIMIEDRVLRFEMAKNNLRINDIDNRSFTFDGIPGYNQGFEASITDIDQGNITGHPLVYVPYCSFHDPTQQYHTFYIPHQPIPIYNSMQASQSRVHSTESSPVSDISSNEIPTKVFVGHLNGELVTQRKLLRYFQRYGHITDIELFKNNLDGSLRLEAFAFVSYLKAEQAQEAIKEEDGQEWLGKRLKCCQALKKRGRGSRTVLEDSEEAENDQIFCSQ